MFRVRRSKLPLLASAVGAALPALSFAQNSATWTYLGPGNNGGPWSATWTDTSVIKPWSPNTTYPNAASANPLFPAAYLTGTNTINKTVTNGLGQMTLNLSGILVNSLNFYGAGSNTLAAPGNVNNVGYQILGSGGITIIPSAGTQVGTIDVSNIGADPNGGGVGTPTTLPGMATLSVSLTQTSGILYKTGVGTLVLDASNNFTGSGGIQVNDGILRITQSNALSGVPVISTGNTGGIELYGNAGSSATAGTAGTFTLLGATSTKYNGANGELAAMGGSNSTWGDASSFVVLTGLPSVGAGASSTLTVASTFLDLGTNGLTKVGAGTVITQGLQLNGPLNVNGGRLKIAPLAGNSNANVSYVHGLTIAGGASPTATVDLTSNDMIVDYTGSTSPAATIAAQLKAGRNGGSWNGPGIISSSVATSPGNDPSERGLTTSLGWADNADLGKASFDGIAIPSTAVLIKYTWPGDANLDGSVDGNDIAVWATHFTGTLAAGPALNWDSGDWNYDGSIDGNDIALWATHFTGTLGIAGLGPVQLSDTTNPQAISDLKALGIDVVLVPEPTALAGIALGLATLVSRRRRRS